MWPCVHPKQRRKRVLVVIHWWIVARCYRLFWVKWYEIGRVLGNTPYPCRYLLYDFSVARIWQSQQSAVSFQFLSSLIIENESSKNKLILFNPVSLKYREINKISYESKMSKMFELSFIFMHLNRNLNTVFLWKRILPVFTKISLFCYIQHGEKREKSVAGHEND